MSLKESTTLFYTLLESGEWSLYMAATQNGLCYVGSQGAPLSELEEWARVRLKYATMKRDDQAMEEYVVQMLGFLHGERSAFTWRLDLHGTAFQQAVWEALSGIPHGETRSYSEIAEMINKKQAVRAVGSAIGANPVLIAVPCHRVIGKSGALTGYRGGIEMKKALLRMENSL